MKIKYLLRKLEDPMTSLKFSRTLGLHDSLWGLFLLGLDDLVSKMKRAIYFTMEWK